MIYAPLVLHQSKGHNYEMSLLRCLLIDNYSIQFEKRVEREREREREREHIEIGGMRRYG